MCWKCGKPLVLNGTVSRSDVCPDCGADVRSCKNCRFYEPEAHYDCREMVDELVKDKERANFCGWFMLAPQDKACLASGAGANGLDGANGGVNSKNSNSSNSPASSASDAFNALFGEKPSEKKPSAGKDAFNALFGD